MAKNDKPNSSAGEDTVQGRNSIYETPVKPKAIKDKTGWKIRPENEMILNGSLKAADSRNSILPEGFDQPKSNKPSHDIGKGKPKK